MNPNQLESSQVYPSSYGFPKHQNESDPPWRCDECTELFTRHDLTDYKDLLVCYKCHKDLLSINSINKCTELINKIDKR